METARALVIHAPHDLRVEPREVPAPGPGEVRVRIRRGGICGSDLHYHRHGGFGTVRLKHPMVLGHEVAGEVEAVGEGVTRVSPGDRVAVNPSRPCGTCRFCQKGLQNHCTDMRFYGSAMRDPHVDGAFREVLTTTEAQCEPVGELDFAGAVVPRGRERGQSRRSAPAPGSVSAIAGRIADSRARVRGRGDRGGR